MQKKRIKIQRSCKENYSEFSNLVISDTFPEKKGKTSKSKETLYATI